jgi:hypothetical protein
MQYHASITANRGPETLYLEWVDGVAIANDYAIHDTEKPAVNGMPKPKLPFDPEEVSDADLVQHISGVKIQWWNRVGGMIESGIVGDPYAQDHDGNPVPIKVSIEHLYSGINGPMGVDRLIKFNLMDGGTRLIKVGALLKVR